MQAVYRFKGERDKDDNGHYECMACSCGGDDGCPHCGGLEVRAVRSQNAHGDKLKGFLFPDGRFVPFVHTK